MLGVGIDWAESFHDVALGVPGKGVIEQFRIDHGPGGVQRLVARCVELEPEAAEVRVVLETRHGLLVEALADAGFTVLPVNPDLVARRRGPAKKKDDSQDARICCLMALDAYLDLRRLIPHETYYAHDDWDRRTENICPEDMDQGNGHSHCMAMLLGTAGESVPVRDGELQLGTWQRVLFIELDRERDRRWLVQVVGNE